MGKFDGSLIVSDLDGTLLGSDKTVSDENLRAIEYFKENGGRFTFITGRMPFFVNKVLEEVAPNAPFGCINGGGIYDHINQKYIWTQPLSDDVLELVRYVDERVDDVGIQINAFDRICFYRENETMEWFRKITGVPNITCKSCSIGQPIAKIVFGDHREEKITRIKELLREHPRYSEFDYIRSEKALYEILPKGISKGTVLVRLAEHLGIDICRTIAVGDYNNDVSMLRIAGVGIAVSNAVPEAKEAADIVTVSNDEHAIARIIWDIDRGKINI